MALLRITRNDMTAAELRAEAARTKNPRQARRMLAIALVLDDHPRRLAAEAGGMDRQTLRDWVRRYNTHGVAGLVDRPHSGRKPRLTPAQMGNWRPGFRTVRIPGRTVLSAGAAPTCGIGSRRVSASAFTSAASASC